jgi:uvrD/REP helicase family protein
MDASVFLGLCLCVLALSLIALVCFYVSLNRQNKEIAERIRNIEPYQNIINKNNGSLFNDLESDLENSFKGRVISSQERMCFSNYYVSMFYDVHNLLKRLKIFKIEPYDIVVKFSKDFVNIYSNVKVHNERVIKNLLDVNKNFFDHCLKYPLDAQQRKSIVLEEDNCLIISSAGSGKTSSIVGKVKYLIDIKHVNPQKILLLSYTNKAAAELTERINVSGLKGYTFHRLALDIIGKVTKEKPLICENTDALFVKIYHELLFDKKFNRSIVEYFIDYQIQNDQNEEEWEKRKEDRKRLLSEQKEARFKAILPDMDGNTIYVRSIQEQKICFVLSSLGVRFRYEEPYEFNVADEMHSQYRPDFSIYFESEGNAKRIYLEHFGVDEHSQVPVWFAKDKGMSYEEANKKYNDGITWKKAVHEKFGTELLTTSSADFRFTDIRNKLKILLERAGVPISEMTETELYNLILPVNSKQEKAFIRLTMTFVTLIKSSCKSFKDILGQAASDEDVRGYFIIKNIFKPVYERYIDALKSNGQIDFTDAILQATSLCESYKPVKYDYIIVDEFQDISIDRYKFLKSLRETNPPAKLYCVGDDWQSIYRFSGSDMALFSHFSDYFGPAEIGKIETTFRFGEPLISLASRFIQRNDSQIKKNIHPFNPQIKTELKFCEYERRDYCNVIGNIVASIPADKSVLLLGRYSFDDYYLSFAYNSVKEGNRFFYFIGNRKVEFLTVHKSKGLEADYVILLQCNKDIYGFPSLINDDPVLNYVLTKSDQFPFGEERRLFYVAITRARFVTYILYDRRFPSFFVNEFLHPEKVTEESYSKHPNANKKWTLKADKFLITLYDEGKSIKYIANKMSRSQTAVVMRLKKLGRT